MLRNSNEFATTRRACRMCLYSVAITYSFIHTAFVRTQGCAQDA